MEKHILRAAFVNSCLILILPILLIWGYPLGGNRLCFEPLKENYPGPVNLTVTSFPFGVYCQELFDYEAFNKEFGNRDWGTARIDIPFVLKKQDTLIVKCGLEKPDTVLYFRITNPVPGELNENIQDRISLLNAAPDISALLNKGYVVQKLDWGKALSSYILEPIIIPLIFILSFLILIMSFINRIRKRQPGKMVY